MISGTQREIIDALIQLYEKKREAVKGEDISSLLKRNPGTIRNQMQTLKALGYVDGVPGPKGGYTPSTKAYEALDIEKINKPFVVHVYRNGDPIEGLSVQKMSFTQIHHPTECKTIVNVLGDTRKIKDHEVIKVGPTPVNHLILRGKVIGRDDTKRELLIESHSITSIPKGKVKDIASKNIVSFTPEVSVEECARVLEKNRISAAPVIDGDRLIGIVTTAAIVKSVAQRKTAGKVKDITISRPLTIDKEAKIVNCIEKMRKHDVGRLIVTEGEKVVGMITKTDIIMRMLD